LPADTLKNPFNVEDGHGHIPDIPRTGIAWNEDAVGQYTVDL